MKMKSAVLLLVAITVFLSADAVAVKRETSLDKEGEKLVKKSWVAMDHATPEDLKLFIDDAFQSVHMDGARTKSAQIDLIMGLGIREYKISNVSATRTGDVMVVTYKAETEETLDGKRIPSRPVPRMSVFINTPDGWKWLAHANLNHSN